MKQWPYRPANASQHAKESAGQTRTLDLSGFMKTLRIVQGQQLLLIHHI